MTEATSTTQENDGLVTFIPKMSVQTMRCRPKEIKDENRHREILCTIAGTALYRDYTVDKVKGETWEFIVGEFIGISARTGKEYRSGKLFLPSGIHETVSQKVPSRTEAEDPAKRVKVDFAFQVSAVKANNPAGYSYEANPLITPTESEDPMARFKKLCIRQLSQRQLTYHSE